MDSIKTNSGVNLRYKLSKHDFDVEIVTLNLLNTFKSLVTFKSLLTSNSSPLNLCCTYFSLFRILLQVVCVLDSIALFLTDIVANGARDYGVVAATFGAYFTL